MFGKIEAITKNYAIVGLVNNSDLMKDLLNVHVVFIDKDKKILGEIEEINKNNMKINFLGELTDDNFVGGILNKPSLDAQIRVINQGELKILVGKDKDSLVLGTSPIYKEFPLQVEIDDLFSNHTAIFGNSGSGKTYGICRIFQNLFSNKTNIPYNANLFIFDSYGEYINAFKDLNKINPNLHYKLISTNSDQEDKVLLELPVHLLELEDVLNLLEAKKFGQIAIIEETIKLARIFASNDANVNRYKNHLLAKAITSIMYTNQTSAKIRDQIFDIVSNTYTNEINLDAVVPGIGFTRIFRSCFDIDSEGRFAERKIISEYIESFIDDNEIWDINVNQVKYGLKDLQIALNFTLFSERYLLNEEMYDEAISLKVKLDNLIKGPYSKYFISDKYNNLQEYINSLIITEGKKAQIININLEDVDDRFARTITKIYSRMFLKFTKKLKPRASFPIHIILEEAHRYVVKNDDVDLIGYNIFERISKEGRKYGLLLDLITQRPTDLNDNVISQIANFLIFKITHPQDLEYITKAIPNINEDIIEKQKSLQSGTCVAFGRIFKIPMIVKMQKANPAPSSANCEIFNNWMINDNNNKKSS